MGCGFESHVLRSCKLPLDFDLRLFGFRLSDTFGSRIRPTVDGSVDNFPFSPKLVGDLVGILVDEILHRRLDRLVTHQLLQRRRSNFGRPAGGE